VQQPTLWRRVGVPLGAAVAAAIVGGAAVWLATHTTVVPPRVSRLQITPPSAAALTATDGATRDVAITRDGTRVIYVGANGNLFVRALDQLDAIPLTGLSGPIEPFVSPDGQWIGFAAGRVLKKVAITGGPPVTLAQIDGAFRGATWAPDGTIVFATNNPATGLQQIAAGGEPTVLTRPDRARGEADHLWPEFLPGRQAVLFTILATTGGLDQAQVAVLDLRNAKQTTLIRGGSDAHYVPNGHLVYGAGGPLRAVGFDLARLAIVGTAVPVVPQVVTTNAGGVDVAVSGDGTLVYVPGVGTGVERTLVWVDRQSHAETPIVAPPHTYEHPRISPDGNRVALHASDQESDIWLWDLLRPTLTRMTFEPGGDIYPVWTQNSRRFFFSSARALFVQSADSAGAATPVMERANGQESTSLSPDGTRLVFHENNANKGFDVMQLDLDSKKVTALVQTKFAERNADVSSDGRWLAYEANDTGQFEIYVTPFPDGPRPRLRVSTAGGRTPVWGRNSPELFYIAPDGALMRVGVGSGPTWAPDLPAKLLDVSRYYTGSNAARYGRMYDIAPDGKRFLMIKPGGGGSESAPLAPTSLVVVQHFDLDLMRLVPNKN
jgi:serine/threonine-protein kinase